MDNSYEISYERQAQSTPQVDHGHTGRCAAQQPMPRLALISDAAAHPHQTSEVHERHLRGLMATIFKTAQSCDELPLSRELDPRRACRASVPDQNRNLS